MSEKTNSFTRCNTKLEAIAKSTTKGWGKGVLYCLIGDSIYVYQNFKLINLSLEHFANGMNIGLVEAQAIVSGAANSVEEAEKMIEQERQTKTVVEEEPIVKEPEKTTVIAPVQNDVLEDILARLKILETILLEKVEQKEEEVENDGSKNNQERDTESHSGEELRTNQ